MSCSFSDCSPIFVVGAARSGTTMLQLMLNAHPNIAILGELHYFDQILQIKNRIGDLCDEENIDNMFNLLSKTYHYRFLSQADELFRKVKQRMLKESEQSFEGFYKSTLEEFGKAQNARRFGEKTPSNIDYLDDLLKIFPKAKIIHIIRDPRAVVASSIKMPTNSKDILIHSLRWRCEMLYSKKVTKDASVYFEIRYEDLIDDTEKSLKKICQFIGEDYHERMLEFHRDANRFIKGEPWKNGTNKPIYRSSKKKWTRELSPGQILLIQKFTGEMAKDYGYEDIDIPFFVNLLLPFIFLNEARKYLQNKVRKTLEKHRGDGELFTSSKSKQFTMFVHSFFNRKLNM